MRLLKETGQDISTNAFTFQLDSISHIHHPAIQCSLYPFPTSLAI
jgi:hypothetical protein